MSSTILSAETASEISEQASAVLQQLLSIKFPEVLSYYKISFKHQGERCYSFCPFHSETKPSFIVFENNNNAFCFGCNKSWDSIQFIRDKESCGFKEAVKVLAKIGEISITNEILDCIVKNYKTFWKRFAGDPIQDEQKKQQQYWKVIELLSKDFMEFCESLKHKKFYVVYWDEAWTEFDRIVGLKVSPEVLDKAKDWSKKYKLILTQQEQKWKTFLTDQVQFWNSIVAD